MKNVGTRPYRKSLYDAVMASIRGDKVDYVVIHQNRAIAASTGLFWAIGMKSKTISKTLSRNGGLVIIYGASEVERPRTEITSEIHAMIYGVY